MNVNNNPTPAQILYAVYLASDYGYGIIFTRASLTFESEAEAEAFIFSFAELWRDEDNAVTTFNVVPYYLPEF